ncbi:Ribonuclease/ribotoxin [Aspergillus flavus]|uniref:Ribonuclease/ribotoxin n=1 Tax=Aspergillus flavus TaxID=5059 RepID=A0A5N6H662_ASPFL|nr:Ribonuclease/ribotoxin [Aspergillus flavus]
MKISVALGLISLALAVPRPPSPALSDTGVSNYNNVNNAAPPNQRPASPAQSSTQPATPNPVPANIEGLDTSYSVKCGRSTFPGADIHRAISLGVDLDRNGKQLGTFPHDYTNYENFNFLNKKCNGKGGLRRREIPIVRGGYFNGKLDAKDNVFRAIYLHNIWETADGQGKAPAIYCGTIYHPKGAQTFQGCDVRKVKS